MFSSKLDQFWNLSCVRESWIRAWCLRSLGGQLGGLVLASKQLGRFGFIYWIRIHFVLFRLVSGIGSA